MSVITFGEGDLFIVRTIKRLASNPDRKWANSYEFKATVAGDSTALETIASVLVLFEASLHRAYVQFDHTLVSTWEADSLPYDPDVFMSIPESAIGAVPATDDAMPLDKAWSVARVPVSGRFGHVFFRGTLSEEEVTAPAGTSVLSSPLAMDSRLEDALISSELESYLGNPALSPLQMVMISADGETVRNVTTLTSKGVASLPTDHAWFNRRPPAP